MKKVEPLIYINIYIYIKKQNERRNANEERRGTNQELTHCFSEGLDGHSSL